MELSEEKTLLTHIGNGFDFLGQNVRKYNGKLLIKPSEKNVKVFLEKVKFAIKERTAAPAIDVLRKLAPMIRCWAMYHRHIVAKKTFQQVDHQIWKYLWKWARRRHARKKNYMWIKVRNYSAKEYVEMINKYPKFFLSLRPNTLKPEQLADELNDGIAKLEAHYRNLKPAKIYFTIGCMRTNGTTRDSLVLIGSELAMADVQTNISEFDAQTKEWLQTFINTNPIENLVLLNVHEYVHTQQNEQVGNLLSIAIREGIAEFVSTLAMNLPSASPAIEFGKRNADAVREKFEQEMFYPNNQHKWFWSNYPNDFGVRDLGYYVGYQMSENYYEKAEDKTKAIKTMIELDYTNEAEIEEFVKETGYFSTSLDSLYQKFENSRPFVKQIRQFENNNQNVDPNTTEITIDFSEPLNGYNTGVDFGELG